MMTEGYAVAVSTNESRHDGPEPGPHPSANPYAELKRLIKQQGLLNRQPMYYTFKISANVGLLALAVASVIAADTFWWKLLSVVFLSFVFVQISTIAHDAGHRQISASVWKNDLIAMLHLGVIGLSASWWIDKHNQHHSFPNQLDADPDINFPVVAFSEEQALRKRGVLRFMVKHQAYFYPFLVLLVPFNMRFHSLRILVQGKAKHPWFEASLIALHVLVYFGGMFALFGFGEGLVFILLNHALVGLYIASIFAPNHKGMPVLPRDHQLSFLQQQVLTSRNIRAHPATDFLYGGLNYQIEHHLFPGMPRNKLHEAQQVVKAFCRSQDLSYYETGAVQSYKEILVYLHRVSAPLRR